MWWVAQVLQGVAPAQLAAPSGTDCVLAAGGLLAIIHTVIVGMARGLSGEGQDPSIAGRARKALAALVPSLTKTRSVTDAQETEGATAERLKLGGAVQSAEDPTDQNTTR